VVTRFDTLGGDRPRWSAFDAASLDGAPDEVLDGIVARAAAAVHAPIALVSLVLRRIQFFRAHIGLPADLALARATDRCASFCQLVVRDQAPLVIEDASRDDRVPQQLVELYGVRAYLGLPLRVHGHALGTLCVLDVRPRSFSATEQAELGALATAAAARLSELVQVRTWAGRRTELTAMIALVNDARITALEVRPHLRAAAGGAMAARALAALADAGRAVDGMDEALGEVERRLRGLLDDVELDERPH
jgi:GAF domain-containing protein